MFRVHEYETVKRNVEIYISFLRFLHIFNVDKIVSNEFIINCYLDVEGNRPWKIDRDVTIIESATNYK